MSVREQLISLQWNQLRHDDSYHKDIVVLPLSQRISHMALHYAKYTSSFFRHELEDDDESLRTTLTDAFAIALATANALNQDLGLEIGDFAKCTMSMCELGDLIRDDLLREPEANSPFWIGLQFARHTGNLAKACESLDHIEPFPFRDKMKEANLSLFSLVLALASELGVDLAHLYKLRMREIEQKSIFDEHFQNNSKGEV